MKNRIALSVLLMASPLLAQETQLQAELRTEQSHFDASCLHPPEFSFGSVGGCAQVLFTDHPLHIAVGSLAPGNGFAAGIAFTTHYTPNESWRLFFDMDAVGTPNSSWRAGGYMTAVFTHRRQIVVRPGASAGAGRSSLAVEQMPAFHAYVQSISLNKLAYFGLGQGTPEAGRSYFGMQESIVGANAVVPVFKPLNLSLFGEVNGRFVGLRGNHSQTSPSIDAVYTDASAPGLANQPGYAQFGEGIRIRPGFAGGHVRLNYSLAFQEWTASRANASFRRFTADFGHQFPLYSTTRSLAPREFNGPDSCRRDANAANCPSVSRNLEGSFGFEVFYTASYIPAGHIVPFYFDPTLGGSDINGTPLLPSYPDYRFRAPNLLLVRGTFEHSIYKWPVGVKFLVDEGRVALTHGDLGFNHLAHSYAAGLTLHAGGLPVVDLLFAWGGHEGTHTIATVNSSLLGGSPRPSLY